MHAQKNTWSINQENSKGTNKGMQSMVMIHELCEMQFANYKRPSHN